jgi:hypothetical protein
VAAQARLAALPGQVAAVLDADADRRTAAARARRAREEADAAPPDRKPAAKRAAEMAAAEEVAAAARANGLVTAMAIPDSTALAATLGGVAGGGVAAEPGAVGTRLASAARELAESVSSDRADRGKVERAAAAARQAVDAAQQAVARARDELADRDPLTAAHWYARAAADALTHKPPDLQAAEQAQRGAADLLDRARAGALRYASGQRMAAVRQLRPAVAVPAEAAPASAAQGGPAAGASSPWSLLVNEWRRLRPREIDEAAGALRAADVPGYEAPLKAYFEALGARKDEKGK